MPANAESKYTIRMRRLKNAANEPVTTSSGIQRLNANGDGSYSDYGREIILPGKWLDEKQGDPAIDAVVREPKGVSGGSSMSATSGAAIFGARCIGAFDGYGDVYVIRGDSPQSYMDRMLSRDFKLLWDGWGEEQGILSLDDIAYDVVNGYVSQAIYMGEVPENVLSGMGAAMSQEAETVLENSLTVLIRLLSFGRDGQWQMIKRIPKIPIETASLGYISPAPISLAPVPAGMAMMALTYASDEALETVPSALEGIEKIEMAAAFGRIWDGIVKDADNRGRAAHIYDLVSQAANEAGIEEDWHDPEWVSVAVRTAGTALGVDFAFDSYVSGVPVEHIIGSMS